MIDGLQTPQQIFRKLIRRKGFGNFGKTHFNEIK